MRGIRAIVVTAACVSAGLLALTGSTLADPASAPPAVVRPAQVQGAPVLDGLGRSEPSEPVVGPLPEVGPVPRTSYATRHVPSREEAALTGALHPATDQVMAYLIGCLMAALIGGGLSAGRERGARRPHRLEPVAGAGERTRTALKMVGGALR